MTLEIKNEPATELNEALGVTEERRLHLSSEMDKIAQKRNPTFAENLKEIVAMCETLEEVVFCSVVHTMYVFAPLPTLKTGKRT